MDLGLRDLLHDAVPFALPLARRFRGVEVREGLLIRGPSGWGEFAPFDDYSPSGAARWLAAAAEAAFGSWPEPVRESVPVNAIIPAVSAADAAVLAREAVLAHGCDTLKVKVAQAGEVLADDEARVASVRAAADAALQPTGRRARLRIDANAAWDVEAAVRALSRLSAYGLEYVEQPCASVEEIAEVRRRVDVPVALDESVRRGEAGLEIADVLIVKVPPLGGVRAAMDLVGWMDRRVVVSGALDTSVGLAAGIALAAALPHEPPACGLGTGILLAADVVSEPMVPRDGRLPVGRVAPDLDALMAARARLSDDRARWWRQRAADAWAAGGAELIAGIAV